MWQWNGNFAGFLEKFLNNSKNYPMKWNLQFSGKWQNWQISQILCIGELEVKVLILEVAMVNVCQFAPNIFSMTSKLYWGQRPKCNPQNLILQIYDFFFFLPNIMTLVPKVNLYVIRRPHLDPAPLMGSKGVQNSKKGQNYIFSGSLHWNHIGWKRLGILCTFIWQTQNIPIFSKIFKITVKTEKFLPMFVLVFKLFLDS